MIVKRVSKRFYFNDTGIYRLGIGQLLVNFYAWHVYNDGTQKAFSAGASSYAVLCPAFLNFLLFGAMKVA